MNRNFVDLLKNVAHGELLSVISTVPGNNIRKQISEDELQHQVFS
jgi:hypothetical protein